MENETGIICPQCGKTLPDDVVIRDALKGEGSFTRHVNCAACGEKISYWQVTAQLREHKTMGWRFRNWLQARMHKQA